MAKKSNIYDSLAASAPVLNERARKQQRQALDIQTAQALGKASLGPNLDVRKAGQQIGADIQSARGQVDAQAATSGQQTLASIAQQASQREAADTQAELSRREILQREDLSTAEQRQKLRETRLIEKQRTEFSRREIDTMKRMQEQGLAVDSQMSFMTRKQREDLSRLGRDAEEKLFFKRMAFQRKEAKDEFAYQEQLIDWTILNAEEHEQHLDRVQMIEQGFQKEMILYEQTILALEQSLKQDFKTGQQKLDQETKRRIERARNEMKRRQSERQAQAGLMKGLITAGTTLALASNPVGWTAAAAIAMYTVHEYAGSQSYSMEDVSKIGETINLRY